MTKTGVWFIGAFGNVATCAAVGAMAFARGLIAGTGLVSEDAEFRGLNLAPVPGFVFGGHDVRKISLPEALLQAQESTGILPDGLLARLEKPLQAYAREIRVGFPTMSSSKADRRPATVLVRLRKDIESFRRRNRLASVVVVNVANAEPGLECCPELRESGDSAEGVYRLLNTQRAFSARHRGMKGKMSDGLEAAGRKRLRAGSPLPLGEGRGVGVSNGFASAETLGRTNLELRGRGLPPSVLYALAAMETGCAYVNFTSSIGASLPGMDELSLKLGVPHAGRDGKTGETLLKTVLAPMFKARRLKLLSWEGHNLLGNSDGVALQDEAARRAKTEHKDAALRKIVGDDSMHSTVRIDYVPSLADWKTAWDFIHFEGFLGARMVLQLLWQGCDSALAAPLVIDLVRFAERALRRGESGPMSHLACFFKDPVGTDTHDFRAQVEMLRKYSGKME